MSQKKIRCGQTDHFDGRYVNYFKIGYNTDVFVIDYFQYFPESLGVGKGQPVQSESKLRLITSPPDAKLFMNSLRAAIKRYEAAYGAIQESKIKK